jgi:hypothetical protein
MQTDKDKYDALAERIARLEERFSELDFFTKEMKGKILHFQTKRDLQASMNILKFVKPGDEDLYYFQGGAEPDFSINGILHHKAANKVTATEYVPALKVLCKIISNKYVLEDFIALGGELACRERGPAIKELRAIKASWKQSKSA